MIEIPRDTPIAVRFPVLAVLVPFAIVFALCNYYRTVNAVLAPYLIEQFSLSAGQLGLLISVYFLVSALFQAPLGLLMDRFGPRRVQAVLIVIAGIGAIVFALGTTWPVLITGRVIMGIGAAGGLMTSIQAVTLWFPAARWPFFNGFVMSLGALGSLTATLPTQYLLYLLDWHHLLVGVALISFIGSLMLFGIVPEKRKAPKGETLGAQLKGMAAIYRDRLFWRFAPLYLATTGSTMAFQSLWAGPWLHDVGALDAPSVASHLLILSLLQIGSYFLVGFIATELGKRNVPLIRIVQIGSALYISTLTPLLLPTGTGMWSVILGIGLLSNVNTLCYPILSQYFSPAMTGRATTALNSFFFVGAFIVQFAIGLVIDLVPATDPGHYPALAYQLAFAVMITLQLCGWAWCLVTPRKLRAAAGIAEAGP
jgi:nitrate/nitrite transporter NarK